MLKQGAHLVFLLYSSGRNFRVPQKDRWEHSCLATKAESSLPHGKSVTFTER